MQVYNKRTPSYEIPKDAIYVGRGTLWGNPFVMKDKSQEERDRVCDAFEQYAESKIIDEPNWLDELRGKSLICWCAPQRCHADTLMRMANG